MNHTSPAIQRPLAKWVFATLLMLIIAWAPLPLGSNRAWSVALLAMLFAGIMPVALWAFWGELEKCFRLLKWPTMGLMLVFAYIQLQAIFHPGDLDDLLKAELGLFAGTLAFLFAFMLAATRAEFAKVLLQGFVVIATAYTLYAFAELGVSERLLWFDFPNVQGDIDATFVNRNTYSTYAGFGVLTGLALLLQSPVIKSTHALMEVASGRQGSLRDLNEAIALVLALLILGAGLMMSESRGGILATGAGAICITALHFWHRRFHWRQIIMPGVIAAVLLTGLLLTTGNGILTRFAQDGFDGLGRLGLAEATLAMIADRPLTGQGFGAWETTFPAFRPESLGVLPDFDQAHNGYLEVLATLGLPLGAIFLSLFAWMAWRCLRGQMDRRHGRIYPRLGLGLCVLAGLHAGVDYSLQIPGLGVSFLFLMGIAAGQSYSRSARHTHRQNTS